MQYTLKIIRYNKPTLLEPVHGIRYITRDDSGFEDFITSNAFIHNPLDDTDWCAIQAKLENSYKDIILSYGDSAYLLSNESGKTVEVIR